MRAILDTNVVVSGILFGGIPRRILESAYKRLFTPVISPEILREYTEVVERVSRHYGTPSAMAALETVVSRSDLTRSIAPDRPVCADPKDDMFFTAAVSAGVDIIVSGDKHLKAASGWSGILVVSPFLFYEKYVHRTS